jgi:hypothetical protein
LFRLLIVRETDARHPISVDRPRRGVAALVCRALRASSALVAGRRCADQSRKSGAMYESSAKYKQRKFRAMNFFLFGECGEVSAEKKVNQTRAERAG